MQKAKLVITGALTFTLIAVVAALFAFSHTGAEVALVGRTVFGVSTALVALSVVVRRPEAP